MRNGFIEILDQVAGQRKDVSGQNEWRYCCPFCHEQKFKFYVDGSTRWICYHCGNSGNAITFVKTYYGMNSSEAKSFLSDWGVGGEAPSVYLSEGWNNISPLESLSMTLGGVPEEAEGATKTCAPIPVGYKKFTDHWGEQDSLPFLWYLHSRGVTAEQISKHHMGYITFGSMKTSSGKELSIRNHVVFLTFDDKGRPVYWNTRSIERNPYIKTFNAPSSGNSYSRADVIFNLNNAVKTGTVVIQEGVFDALTVGDSGVATFGKIVTDRQISLIKKEYKHNPNLRVYVFLDSDAKDQTLKLVKSLLRFSTEVYIVVNETRMDANDMGHDKCWELIKGAYHADSMGLLAYITNA